MALMNSKVAPSHGKSTYAQISLISGRITRYLTCAFPALPITIQPNKERGMTTIIRHRRPANSSIPPKSAPSQPTIHSIRLLKWDDLPAWAKDNEYIHSGFRPSTNSYKDCLQSCFYIHNETGNIYSHLLATLWMIILPIFLYPYAKEHYHSANFDDWIVLGLFFLGGAVCFGLSTVYHVFSSHSHAVHDVYLRLDLLGISTVTAGCFPPGVWYTFPCASRETKIFWIGVWCSFFASDRTNADLIC